MRSSGLSWRAACWLSVRRRRILRNLPRAVGRARYRLRELTADELRLFVSAPVALPLAAAALRRWGLQDVQSKLARWCPPSSRWRHVDQAAAARRITWCVLVGAAYGPWPANCLQRSVVLWWFLLRRGIESELRIGVRRSDNGGLDFHAWIEHAGDVISDRPEVRGDYATFDRAIAPRSATFR